MTRSEFAEKASEIDEKIGFIKGDVQKQDRKIENKFKWLEEDHIFQSRLKLVDMLYEVLNEDECSILATKEIERLNKLFTKNPKYED